MYIPMADINAQIKAAFSMDSQSILKTFSTEEYIENKALNFNQLKEDAKLVYLSLVESKAIQEANYFKAVMEDAIGRFV